MLGNLVGQLLAGRPLDAVVAKVLCGHIVTGDVQSVGIGLGVNLILSNHNSHFKKSFFISHQSYLNQCHLGHRRHMQTLMEQRHGVHNVQSGGRLTLAGQQHSVDGQVRILGGVQDHFRVGARREMDVGHGCGRANSFDNVGIMCVVAGLMLIN